MRRILFTVLASAAVCVAAPAMALAHNGHRHHKRHHHARVRHEQFFSHRHDGDNNDNPAGSTEPTAGTVTMFANNVLTITLANHNTVSGEVTNDTEIKCENPEMQNGDNDGDETGDAVFRHSDGGGDQRDQGDDNHDQMCTPATGMAVRKAELTINGNGAFWDEIELVPSSSSTTGSQS